MFEERERRARTDEAARPAPRATTPELIRTLQRSAGNAAVARALGRRMLQRLVVCMASPSDDDKAAQELAESVKYLDRKPVRQGGRVTFTSGSARGAVINVGKNEPNPLKGLKSALAANPAEAVYILSHSEGARVGGLDAKTMAAELNRHLPPDFTGKIKFVACSQFAAYTGVNAYAQAVARELAALERTAIPSVEGPGGTSTIDPATGARRAYPVIGSSAKVTTAVEAWKKANKPAALAEFERLDQAQTDALKRKHEAADALRDATAQLIQPQLAAYERATDAENQADLDLQAAEDADVAAPSADTKAAVTKAKEARDKAAEEAKAAGRAYKQAKGAVKDDAGLKALEAQSNAARAAADQATQARMKQWLRWKGSADEKQWLETVAQKVSELQLSVGKATEREGHWAYQVSAEAPRIKKEARPVIIEGDVVELPAATEQ